MLRTVDAPSPASVAELHRRRPAFGMIEREARALALPAFGYRIVPVVEVRGEAIDVGEAILHAPGLAAESGGLRAVAAAACTLGTAIQDRISALFEARQPSRALALDIASNELLFRLADRVLAAIRREARRDGLLIGIDLSPGDPGVPLGQQTAVLGLADAARQGIATTEAGMLFPVKSLSFVVALGSTLRRRSTSGRCNCCPSRERCTVK